MEDRHLNVTSDGLTGLKFTISDSDSDTTYIVRPENIGALYDLIGNYIDWFNIYQPIISFYGDDFVATGIKDELDAQERSHGDSDSPMCYYIVENLALFTGNMDESGRFDNKTAMENLVKEYEGLYGESHGIKFDNDTYEVLVETESRESAERVFKLIYESIIKPGLDKLKSV